MANKKVDFRFKQLPEYLEEEILVPGDVDV